MLYRAFYIGLPGAPTPPVECRDWITRQTGGLAGAGRPLRVVGILARHFDASGYYDLRIDDRTVATVACAALQAMTRFAPLGIVIPAGRALRIVRTAMLDYFAYGTNLVLQFREL